MTITIPSLFFSVWHKKFETCTYLLIIDYTSLSKIVILVIMQVMIPIIPTRSLVCPSKTIDFSGSCLSGLNEER
jgi:hypothetical protein